jgi:hypothetical protein
MRAVMPKVGIEHRVLNGVKELRFHPEEVKGLYVVVHTDDRRRKILRNRDGLSASIADQRGVAAAWLDGTFVSVLVHKLANDSDVEKLVLECLQKHFDWEEVTPKSVDPLPE